MQTKGERGGQKVKNFVDEIFEQTLIKIEGKRVKLKIVIMDVVLRERSEREIFSIFF